jgi:ribose-phosphate pyrophosphokinase
MTKAQAACLLFDLDTHPVFPSLLRSLDAEPGTLERRSFPDGESYLRVCSTVAGRDCVILADMSRPDPRFLPLAFLAGTLRELGARSVGLVLPYLCYMRQDIRFQEGEALTSAIFARQVSQLADWLVTVDPHLHRYHSLDQIYAIPGKVVHGAQLIGQWLQGQERLLLVGPDEESRQWVSAIAALSGHPWVLGSKQRFGDRKVGISLPALDAWQDHEAVIIDDVISSGHTVLQCMEELQAQGISRISCACVHGLFADAIDERLMQAGLQRLVSTNSIPHPTNALDLGPLLAAAVAGFLASWTDCTKA